jgi:hypothetical protein
MEKDVAAQLSSLKAQVDKTIQVKEAASQPGAIQLSIQNAANADAGTLKVTLTNSKNQTIQEAVAGASWTKINVVPGQYELKVDAIANGQAVQRSQVIIVKPGEVLSPQVTL